jgi:hypothetical protein
VTPWMSSAHTTPRNCAVIRTGRQTTPSRDSGVFPFGRGVLALASRRGSVNRCDS